MHSKEGTMTIKDIEKLNCARLPRKCRADALLIPDDHFLDVTRAWKNGDNDLLSSVLNQYRPAVKKPNGDRDWRFYIIAIWFHPLTKFQQLLTKVEKLK